MKKNYKRYITKFLLLLIIITTFISVGFCALNQNLNISSDIDYEEYNNTLYGVLKKEKSIGTYASEYTGTHHDSYTEEPTKSIYYWSASNETDATVIQDKFNVIFGGFCWQMYRTTDTGGVRLIYNGVPSNGKCNNSGTAQQIGTSKYNNANDSLAYAGYMYNTQYYYLSQATTVDAFLTSTSMYGTNYYYGTGVTYSSGTYTLTGITQGTWTSTYSSSSGKYTCRSDTTTSCSTVYYIAGGTSNYMYGFTMTGGNLLSYYNTNVKFGTGYTENNGTYTLTGVSTYTKADWFNNYQSLNKSYTCGNNSTSCTTLLRITSTTQYQYRYISTDEKYIFAKGYSYNSSTNTYTLNNDRVEHWDMVETENRTSINTHHYTCFDQTGQCRYLSYVYYLALPSSLAFIYYYRVSNGKSIEDYKNEMLYNDDVNTRNSTIKTYIDNWYSTNMTSYTDKLEDTIFCANRAQYNESSNGWYPNGGSVSTTMNFDYDTFVCPNDTDKFCLSNSKAQLTYPVGLINHRETFLIPYVLKTGQSFWLLSPFSYNKSTPTGFALNDVGISNGGINSTHGVRPVVSLKPGTEYTSGDGSKNNPYIV